MSEADRYDQWCDEQESTQSWCRVCCHLERDRCDCPCCYEPEITVEELETYEGEV